MICPICESKGHPWFSLHDLSGSVPKETLFNIYRCENCRCSYIYPMPNRETLAQAYSGNYYAYDEQPKVPARVTPMRRWNWAEYFIPFFKRNHVELLREELMWSLSPDYEIKNILDVGCGSGQYACALSQLFPHAKVVGQDEFLEYCKPIAGENIRYVKAIDQCAQEGVKFDLIVVRNVIEHFTQPKKVFEDLKKVSTDKTKIFIQTPNLDAVDAKLFGKAWFGFEIPRHTIVFTEKSLEIFAEKTGWKMQKWRTHFVPGAWLYFLSTDYFSRYYFGKLVPRSFWKYLAPIFSVFSLITAPFKRSGDIEAVFTSE